MKVCEVCGTEEEWEESEQNGNKLQMGWLHICDNCQQDRKFHFDSTV